MNDKTLIALLLIIIGLLVVLGVVLINPFDAKTDTALSITSNDTLNDGDYFSISLTDFNGTPLTNQTVNVTIVDANGGENHQQVTTDNNGNGRLQLNGLTPGNYTFNVTYGGDEKYSSCNITQKIEIRQIVTSLINSSENTNTISTSSTPYNTEPVYDGRTVCYRDGIRGVYSRSGEFFADEGQFH